MIDAKDKIRIAIDISVTPGVSGGIAQSTQGLVSSLGQLDGPEDYVLVANTFDQAEWIGQYCGPSQRIVTMPRKTWRNGAGNYGPGPRGIKRVLRPALNAVRHAVKRLSPQSPWPAVAVSGGFYEGLGC